MNEAESQAAALESYFTRHPERAQGAGRSGVFRALPGAYLARFGDGAMQCLQSYRPLADDLTRLGFAPVVGVAAPLDLAMVFATKHKEEVLYHLALAAEALVEGGMLIISAANTLGAPSLERRCAELMGNAESYSKHKCRVIHAVKQPAGLNQTLLDAWRRAGEMRQLSATGLYSCPGLFSWKTIDPGSRLLAAQLPADLAGRGADLGAGYGYLSREALRRAPGITELHLVEAERKALDAAGLNLQGLAGGRPLQFHWADITAGLPFGGLDFVLMNPPFHAGRGAVPALGRAFVRAALMALKPGGRLFMIANRHLPYEGEIQAQSGAILSAVQEQGFKVLVARRMTD